MEFKDKFLIALGMVVSIVIFIFALKALIPTEHKPSEIMTDTEKFSIFKEYENE